MEYLLLRQQEICVKVLLVMRLHQCGFNVLIQFLHVSVFKLVDFITDYSPEPCEEDLNLIKLEDPEDLEVLSIAVIPEDYKKTTL